MLTGNGMLIFFPRIFRHEFVVVKAYFHEDREVIDEIMASLNW